MEENKNSINTIDEYIMQFTPEVQEKLRMMRKIVKEAAPEAKEKMSWKMPTFDLYGNLVHFAAHKKHIGFYPGVNGIEELKLRSSQYQCSKGAVQFPYEKPLPLELISEIVRFRVIENIKEMEIKNQNKIQNKKGGGKIDDSV